MTRKKVKIARISNDTARKATFRKRKAGLFKKLEELTILCDVEAGAVIYNQGDDEPTVWPSESVMEELVTRFEAVPPVERTKKMVSHESYLAERVAKETEKIKKEEKKNHDREMGLLINQMVEGADLQTFDLRQLQGMHGFALDKLKQLRERRKASAQQQQQHSYSDMSENEPPPPPPPPPAAAMPPSAFSPSLPSLPPLPPQVEPFEYPGHGYQGGFEIGDSSSSILPALRNDQWFMDTMFPTPDMAAGPSGQGNMGLPPPLPPPPDYGASSSGTAHQGQQGDAADDEPSDSLNQWHRYYFP